MFFLLVSIPPGNNTCSPKLCIPWTLMCYDQSFMFFCAFPNPCKNGLLVSYGGNKNPSVLLLHPRDSGSPPHTVKGGLCASAFHRRDHPTQYWRSLDPPPLELICVALPHHFTCSYGLRPGCKGFSIQNLERPPWTVLYAGDQYTNIFYLRFYLRQIISASERVPPRFAQHPDRSDRISKEALIHLAKVQLTPSLAAGTISVGFITCQLP